ncbi:MULTISPECIES: DsbA family oxidoreductase [Sediminimonas]|uniref:DsbA family oxidoreductase n=1 Tax=Sediminimonas TaxID=659427 RepID=UPI0004032ECF|nr:MULTISPECIES: DsbA family oxidoreductase [Sediminimonas]MDR9483731.1 DsbA family oxidoreductase [Sediminimonas sp.]
MVKLDIMSDPICPWCHIGKAQLDHALSERPNHPFEIEWHPFQLNPEMPAEGMDRRAYLEAKFGGKEQAAEVYSRIDAAARAAGLEIDFAAIGRTPNTINAHRLIHWAGIEGRQTAMVSALFAAYFHQGRDIGRTDVLADIADSVEMDASVVMRLLETDADRDTIVERDKAARDMGISAVPTFIVAGQHAVPGAQPPETWLNVIDEISSRGA